MLTSLRNIYEYNHFKVLCQDGTTGMVDDILLDDERWGLRYLVVDLRGRKIAVCTLAVETIDWADRTIRLTIGRDELENCPQVISGHPVAHPSEVDYFDYFGWPYYWSGPWLWGSFSHPSRHRPHETHSRPISHPMRWSKSPNSHLHSIKGTLGYKILSTEGDFGNLSDWIVDTETWGLESLLVDTHPWWPGDPVMVSCEWVQDINSSAHEISVALSRSAISNSPRFDDSDPVNLGMNQQLLDYYGRPAR